MLVLVISLAKLSFFFWSIGCLWFEWLLLCLMTLYRVIMDVELSWWILMISIKSMNLEIKKLVKSGYYFLGLWMI